MVKFFKAFAVFSYPNILNMVVLVFAILACLYIFGCKSNEKDNVGPVDVKLASSKVVSASTDFGIKLFSELVKQKPGENIFISPLSIEIALSMTYNGAQKETQTAMARVLGLEGMSLQEVNQANASLLNALKVVDKDVLLEIANSLWARKGVEFNPDFLKRNQDFYDARTSVVDFSDPSTLGTINGWISEKTRGKINNMLDMIPPDAMLYLINALYFKGIWTIQFDKTKTKEMDFTLLDGSKKKVQMMWSKEEYMYYRGDRFEAISLPYGNGRTSMYIFLPDSNSSLEEFQGNLNTENWNLWMNSFHKIEQEILLPRFKLEYKTLLNDPLKALGMGIAFGTGANFGGICLDGIFISRVLHNTFVEVNEEGTEAAAATVVEMMKSSLPKRMIVDRPFFCAIRDKETGAILFMGSIVNP